MQNLNPYTDSTQLLDCKYNFKKWTLDCPNFSKYANSQTALTKNVTIKT